MGSPGAASTAVPSATARSWEQEGTPGWSTLLTVDWTPRAYEVVALAFGLIVTLLLRATPLPMATPFAWYLVDRALVTFGSVMAAGSLLVAWRVCRHASRQGWASLADPQAAVPLLLPYFSLDFLVLTARRLVAVFTGVFFFLHLKHVILWLHFANYDQLFWDLDRWLHLGIQPNVWLMERLGRNHDVAILIDWLYIKYFDFKVIVALLFLCELRGRRLSEQFFLAYTLLWAVGGLSYLVMPTDGPCFAVLLGQSQVPPAMQQWSFPIPITTDVSSEYLATFRESKIWTAKLLQNVLWSTRWNFVNGVKGPAMFYGIAAMPSLHVAAVVLLAVFLWKLSGWAGLVGIAYALTIAIGSVFLQWHYAVDGYAGALLAVAIAWVALRTPALALARGRRATSPPR